MFDPSEGRHDQYHSYLHGAIPSYVAIMNGQYIHGAIIKDFM